MIFPMTILIKKLNVFLKNQPYTNFLQRTMKLFLPIKNALYLNTLLKEKVISKELLLLIKITYIIFYPVSEKKHF
jgi:hypothetical protein